MDLTIHFIFILSVSYVHGFRNIGLCGKGTSNKMAKRIVGGNEADTSDWGWQVSILKKDIDTGEWRHFCGGSIINQKWILSAAHCFDDGTSSRNYKVDSPHIPYYIYIENIFWPGNFNDKTLLHDIALIKLKQKLDFNLENLNLYPICLPVSNSWAPNLNYDCNSFSIISKFSDRCLNSYAGYAIGWGRTNIKKKSSSVLMEAKLEIHTLSDCKIIFKSLGFYYNKDYMTCAGSGTKGICNGDSGGPLMIFKDNAWYQVGITSFGHRETCHTTSGFTRVDAYIEWIDKTIEKYG